MATEISSSAWSETDASNNTAPPAGAPESMVLSSVNDVLRMVMGALKRVWNRINPTTATTGSANAYVLTPSAALGAYVTGEIYAFRSNFTNTGAATLNISGLGAKSIKRFLNAAKVAMKAGEIASGQPVQVAYDGTDMVLMSAAGNILPAFKVGSFTRALTTASGNQTVTGVGFTPRAVIFIGISHTATPFSVGFDDGTASVSGAYVNDVPPVWYASGGTSIELYVSPAVHYGGSVSSFNSDGFVIAWVRTGAPAGTGTVYYIAFP